MATEEATSTFEISTNVNNNFTGSYKISFLQIFYAIVGIIGFLDNLAVIIIIGTSRAMRRRHTNWLLLNQSVADLLTAGVLAIQTYLPTIRITNFAGVLYCKFWRSQNILWAFAMTSTYNLLMISLERYVAIVHPVWRKNHMTKRLMMAALITPWVIGLTYNVYVPTNAHVIDESCFILHFRSLFAARAVGITTFTLQFAVPLLLMVVFYTRIALVFTRGRRAAVGSAVGSAEKSRAKSKENVLKTLATVSVAFVLCWSWNQVFFLMFNLGAELSMSSEFYYFSVVATHANCAVNPLIYAAKYMEFRKAAYALVRRGQVGLEDPSTQETTSTNA